MNWSRRLISSLAIGAFLLPAAASADVNVRSCCVLTEGNSVSACIQFSDILSGDPTADQQTAVRQAQQYKCQDVPYTYNDRSSNTARYIINDAQNSGVCGTALSASCTSQTGVAITRYGARSTCSSDSDCLFTLGGNNRYLCEDGFCRVNSGLTCTGAVDSPANCVNGLLCREGESGRSCMSATATSSGSATAAPSEDVAVPFTPVVPILGVPIPGFSFTSATEVDGIVTVPYLSQYVNALYRYMTAIVLTLAIVMVVYGGFRYLLAATPFAVQDGKKIISDALVGMMLVLGAYVVLNSVNPALLSLRSLQFERITPTEIELSAEFGWMAADGDEAPEGSDVASAAPGTWRANALAVCGDRDVSGMSLDQRNARLKTIVTTWTELAANQKGSVYVRGGSLQCGAAAKEYSYKASTLKRIKASGYAVNVSEACLENPPPNSVSSSDACATSLSSEYTRLISTPGNANGLICGDCGTYQRSLMRCFGGNSYANALRDASFGSTGACNRYAPGRDDIAFIKITDLNARRNLASYDDAEVTAFINRLQFGDMLLWSSNGESRHVFMYTGKAGLPYEIVEMGGGGQGDVIGGSDGRSFWAKIGLPNFNGSHVKAHRSAIDYIKSSPRSGAKCMKAVRVIDN